MKTYECTVLVDASWGYTITADNPEQAAEMAEAQAAEDGVGSLCHQCSNKLSTGDFYAVMVYDSETSSEVLNTDFREQAIAKLKDDIAKHRELLRELSNWLVCEGIATPEDMAQSFTPFREAIDALLAQKC